MYNHCTMKQSTAEAHEAQECQSGIIIKRAFDVRCGKTENHHDKMS